MENTKLSAVLGALAVISAGAVSAAALANTQDLTSKMVVATGTGNEQGCSGKEGGCSGGDNHGKHAKRKGAHDAAAHGHAPAPQASHAADEHHGQ